MPTLGELEAEGWHGLEVRCHGCHYIVDLIWAYLKQPPALSVDDAVRRMRCRRCGRRPEAEDVRPYHLVDHYSRRPHPASAPPAMDRRGEGGDEGG